MLLLVAAFSIFTMAAGATCTGCGCYTPCPSKAEIQQQIWMKEAACFLYSDDCCYAAGTAAPFAFGTPAGNSSPEYYLGEADRLYLAGSYIQAAELYRKAVEIDPFLQKGWLNLGNALFFMRRYEESLIAYDSVLGLDPQNENALMGKVGALSALNRTEEADAVMGMVERLQGSQGLQGRKTTQIGGLSSAAGTVEPVVVGSR